VRESTRMERDRDLGGGFYEEDCRGEVDCCGEVV
jgi:hypothetical protein